MKLPRFTLRDLFWLVLVCALAVGWWVDRQRANQEIEKLTKAAAYDQFNWNTSYLPAGPAP